MDKDSLQQLAEQLQHAHDQLRESALLLGGEACYAQARLDVRHLVDVNGLELPEAMHVVYRKIIAQLASNL